MNGCLDFKFAVKASLATREFEGHGSVFGNVDLGGDVVMPGAFSKTLAEHKANKQLPLMFWSHRPDQVAGKWLEMREDSSGLYVKGVLADTPLGNEMHELLKLGAVRGLSIGFSLADGGSQYQNGVRLLKEIDLWEVSLVSLPMNQAAQVTAAKDREYFKGPPRMQTEFVDDQVRDMLEDLSLRISKGLYDGR